MDTTSLHSFLTDILHAFAQALLAPDIILLLLFAGYALFSIGSILVEFFTERRNFKVAMPKFLAALMAAEEKDIPGIITDSGLLNRQKSALLTVFDYRTLPGDALLALIRRMVHNEETHYDKITGRNNMAAKISPMLGLMGTLIPLGPGIEALGRNDTSALSSSLLIAFDTTVAGLIVAAICLAIGKIRSNWYNDYLSALDSGMATMLQKIEDMRASGTISTQKPTNYTFMFEEGLKKNANTKANEGANTAAHTNGASTPTQANDAPTSTHTNGAGVPAGMNTPTGMNTGTTSNTDTPSNTGIASLPKSPGSNARSTAPSHTSATNPTSPSTQASRATVPSAAPTAAPTPLSRPGTTASQSSGTTLPYAPSSEGETTGLPGLNTPKQGGQNG